MTCVTLGNTAKRAACCAIVVVVIRELAIVMLVAWCARAHADGLGIADGSPRAIGRAGVGLASDDGGGALLLDPAALARRDTTRIQIGAAFIDDAVDWLPDTAAPDARDQSGSSTLPYVAVEAGIGDWVVGAGVMTSALGERAFGAPGQVPPELQGDRFLYRYAGISGTLRRDTVTVGVARRLGDWLALGVSGGLSRVTANEDREVWAGFSGRDEIKDPAHDVDVSIHATDDLVPSAVAGVFVAPPDTRIELAASVGWSGVANVSGDAEAAGSTEVGVRTTEPTASVELHQPLTLRAGARWVGSRSIAEVNGNLWLYSDTAQAATWKLAGVTIVDESGVTAPLGALPSRISARTHGAVRGAIDVELISGFLWATAGYAYTTGGTSASRQSPTFAELGGHTAAAGLEATSGGTTVTLGWAHTWSTAREVPNSSWRLDNPFGAGDAEVPLGRYDGSVDLVGLQLEVELPR